MILKNFCILCNLWWHFCIIIQRLHYLKYVLGAFDIIDSSAIRLISRVNKNWILQMLWIWLQQICSMLSKSMTHYHFLNLQFPDDNPHHHLLWEHGQFPLREYQFHSNSCHSFCRIGHCRDLLYYNLDIS